MHADSGNSLDTLAQGVYRHRGNDEKILPGATEFSPFSKGVLYGETQRILKEQVYDRTKRVQQERASENTIEATKIALQNNVRDVLECVRNFEQEARGLDRDHIPPRVQDLFDKLEQRNSRQDIARETTRSGEADIQAEVNRAYEFIREINRIMETHPEAWTDASRRAVREQLGDGVPQVRLREGRIESETPLSSSRSFRDTVQLMNENVGTESVPAEVRTLHPTLLSCTYLRSWIEGVYNFPNEVFTSMGHLNP